MPTRPLLRSEDPDLRKGSKPGYWRVSTLSKENIDLAVAASHWGTARGLGMKAMKPGDKIVFYVSRGHDAGYWGAATVASEVFVSHAPIWIDDIYPHRFRFTLDLPLRGASVRGNVVKDRLGGQNLTFLNQVGVIPLTKAEYVAIVDLLREPPK